MDMRYMSSTALQMKINELMRENDDLKKELVEKDTKISELTNALQNKENKVKKDAEMETIAYAMKNLKTVSSGALRDAVGAEKYDEIMSEKKVVENKREFDWDILIPIGCVAFALVMLIVGEICGMM